VRLLVGATYTVIFVGLLVNASIAGLGLLIPVALATWLTFGRQRPALRRTFAIVAVAATAAVILLVVIGPLGSNLFGRQTSHVELSRQTSFALTFRAARDHLPFGSGVGSFQSIYHTQEPLSSVTPTYMNHAHNDWLELLLETGIPGMVLAALLLFWGARRALALWRGGDRDPFAQAAVIAAAAILLHSLVDYPLRTAALSTVFAACVALLAGARPHVRRREKLSSAKHLNL
jgi:O-antigen ligase